jgi:hypothetical protein
MYLYIINIDYTKNNTMKKLILIPIVMLAFSCKKGEESTSVKQTLTNHTWKSTALTTDGTIRDKWCWLNSLYNYTEDGKLFYTQGDNHGACSGSTIGAISTYKWKLSSDNKWIITQKGLAPPFESDSFQIVSIDETTLKTKRVVNKDTPPGNTWEETFTAVP